MSVSPRSAAAANHTSANNPVLIGQPGVGKTAIAEGLARRIAQGDVSPTVGSVTIMGWTRRSRAASFSMCLRYIRGSQRVTDQNPESKYQALKKYGRDLTKLATRRSHHGRGDRRGGGAFPQVHHRPIPARQSHRPHR